MHRDIKSSNIFISSDNKLKLADFGMARNQSVNESKVFTTVGTPLYMAPEIVEQRGHSFKADVWSLGCVFYEILAQQPPFLDYSYTCLMEKITCSLIPELPEYYSFELREFIISLLERDVELRPSIQEVVEGKFISRLFDEFNEEKSTFISSRVLENFMINENGLKKEFSSLKTYRFSEFQGVLHSPAFESLRKKSFFAQSRGKSEGSVTDGDNESVVGETSEFTQHINGLIDNSFGQAQFISAQNPRNSKRLTARDSFNDQIQWEKLIDPRLLNIGSRAGRSSKLSIFNKQSLSNSKYSNLLYSFPNELSPTAGGPPKDSFFFMDNYLSLAMAARSLEPRGLETQNRKQSFVPSAEKRPTVCDSGPDLATNFGVNLLSREKHLENAKIRSKLADRRKFSFLMAQAADTTFFNSTTPLKAVISRPVFPSTKNNSTTDTRPKCQLLVNFRLKSKPPSVIPSKVLGPCPVSQSPEEPGKSQFISTPISLTPCVHRAQKSLNLNVLRPLIRKSISPNRGRTSESKKTSLQPLTPRVIITKSKQTLKKPNDENQVAAFSKSPSINSHSDVFKISWKSQMIQLSALKELMTQILGSKFLDLYSLTQLFIHTAGIKQIEEALHNDVRLLALVKKSAPEFLKQSGSLITAKQLLSLRIFEIKSNFF